MPRRAVPVRQLPSGRWQVRYRDEQGRQRAESFDREREARTFYARMLADRSRGRWIDPDDQEVTFGAYAAMWSEGQPWVYSTRLAFRASMKRLEPLHDVPLGRLRPTTVQAVITAMQAELAPSTIKLIVQHLRQVLNAAVADRMIHLSPATKLRLPRAAGDELMIPTPDEVEQLLEVVDERYRALIAVGAGLGLRQGEAFGLSVDRVDFLRRRVTVDRQLVRLARGSALAPPKTPRSVRTIPLPDSVAVELARHLERFPTDDPDRLLFQAPLGGRLRRDGWNRQLKPAVLAIGRPELTYHTLRHFYASALIRRGLSVVAVASRLGNSPAMVLSTYAHLWRDDDDRTREAIDAVLLPRQADGDVVHALCTVRNPAVAAAHVSPGQRA